MAKRLRFIDLEEIRDRDKRLIQYAEKERDNAIENSKYAIISVIEEMLPHIPESNHMTILRRLEKNHGQRTGGYIMKLMCRIVEKQLAAKDAVLDDEND